MTVSLSRYSMADANSSVNYSTPPAVPHSNDELLAVANDRTAWAGILKLR